MVFKLEDRGVHFWCSSPVVTARLLEKGARLVDDAQAEYLRRATSSVAPAEGPAKEEPRLPRR